MIKKTIEPYLILPREVYFLFISKTINSMGNFVTPLLTLILTGKIGMSKGEAGLYLTILSMFFGPGLILGGKLVDSIGRKKVIIIFQGLAAVLFIICGFTRPSRILVYTLIASTTCFSVTVPAYEALTADLTDESNRKNAYALLYMGHNLGFAIGPVIAGMLYKNYLPLVFILDALSTVISISLITKFISEKHHNISQGLEHNKNKEIIKKSESVFSVLMKKKVLLYFAVILFFYNFSYSQWGFTMPLSLSTLFQDNGAKYYGILAGFNGIIIILSTPILSRATIHLKSMRAIALGGLLYSLSFGMLAFTSMLKYFFLSVFIMTVGEVLVSINTSSFIASHTPASHRGRINAVMPIIFGAGYTLGPVAMGSFLNVYDLKTAWVFISIIIMLSSALMLVLHQYSSS